MLVSIFVGSLRRGSYSQMIADTAAQLGKEQGIEMLPTYLDLPAYNPDLEKSPELLPESAKNLRSQIAESDALLFVIPEYNAGVPGFVKNAIDWISRPRESASIQGKPSIIIANSPSPFGGLWAAESLQKNLAIAGSETIGQVTIGKISEKVSKGLLVEEEALEKLESFFKELLNREPIYS